MDEEAACVGLELDAYVGYVVQLGSYAWPVFDRNEATAFLGLQWDKPLLDTPDWTNVGNREGSTRSFVGDGVRRKVMRAVLAMRNWLENERMQGTLKVQGPFSSLEQTLILDAAWSVSGTSVILFVCEPVSVVRTQSLVTQFEGF